MDENLEASKIRAEIVLMLVRAEELDSQLYP